MTATGPTAANDRLTLFAARAEPLGVRVGRMANAAAAGGFAAALATEFGTARPIVAAELLDAAPELVAAMVAAGVKWAAASDPATTNGASLGIGLARLAIAETGSVLLAEDTLADRAIGMLAAAHLVVCPTGALVASLDDAAAALRAVAARPGGGYATMVTGPSRTADIERVLTVGVQGPARVAVLFVDDLG